MSALINDENNLFYLQNYFKSELLSKIRTGDPIIDTIIGIAILGSQDTIIKYFGKIRDLLANSPWILISLIKKFKRWYRLVRYKEDIETETKTVTIKYITDSREINTLFEPVHWYINNLTDTIKETSTSLETTKNNPGITQKIPKQRTSKINFLDHEITYQISTEMITIYAEREHKRENIIINLLVEVKVDRKTDIFEKFADMCIKQYQEYNTKQQWKQKIYRNENGEWISKESKTSRKLSTVILKDGQIDDITDDINTFTHQEEWYVSRDVPYTRRYMFYGVPGTGKSSCIKALACHTKRHIHYLVLSSVKSDAELFKLFESVSFEQTILVIEDIDCASDITHEREDSENPEKGGDPEDHENSEDPGTLTLSGLLNAIDGGIVENHGQIMVMTTNHPEVLDHALVRPGRIDLKFNFSNCDTKQIEGLFYNFFDRMPTGTYTFPENKYSPAEITSVLLQYKKDPDYAWNKVVEKFGNDN